MPIYPVLDFEVFDFPVVAPQTIRIGRNLLRGLLRSRIATMVRTPQTPTNETPQRRLPNYLLSSSPTPSPTPFSTTSAIPQQRPEVTFNARLRENQATSTVPTLRKPDTRTPSRKPPNKSLLEVGPPSIHSIRSPSASPAPASITPSQNNLDRWVTIFGFPPALESQVLREFRRHGEVMRTIPGKGNWVHVLYRTPMQAEVALHTPWRLLAGTDVMVGIVPCTDPVLATENDQAIEKGILVASPSGASPFTKGDGSPGTPNVVTPGLRTPASVLRRDQGTAPQNIVRTPQKQPGFFDYLTGFYK